MNESATIKRTISRREYLARTRVVDTAKKLYETGNTGEAGNVSERFGDSMLITASGVPYEAVRPAEHVVRMPLGGNGEFEGETIPSSEWRFHSAILRTFPDVHAVVHSHPTYATAFAMARRELTASHYVIALAGAPTVRCAPYATYGTEELSRNVVAALSGGRKACLLANHGLITVGTSLKAAFSLSVELEALAKQTFIATALGGAVVLPDEEIERVIEKLKTYGQPSLIEREGRGAR